MDYLKEIKGLLIWDYLGADLYLDFEKRFSYLPEADLQNALMVLSNLDSVREEVISKGGEAAFINVLEKTVFDLMIELVSDLRVIDKQGKAIAEVVERDADLRRVDDLISKI